MNPNNNSKDHLEIHKLLSEDLRNSANIIWKFSISIITVQGGALALGTRSGFPMCLSCTILAGGFFLSVCLSVMLLRQAYERRGFVHRIHSAENELSTTYPEFSIKLPRTPAWFTSVSLAWILLSESIVALISILAICAFSVCSSYCSAA